MDSSEVMFVLMSEDEHSVDEEFEARILSDLPSILLFFLDVFFFFFHSNNRILYAYFRVSLIY